MNNFRRRDGEIEESGSGLTLSGYNFNKTAASLTFYIDILYDDVPILNYGDIIINKSENNCTISLLGSDSKIKVYLLPNNSKSTNFTSTVDVTYNGKTVQARIILSSDSIQTTTTKNSIKITNITYGSFTNNATDTFRQYLYPVISGEIGTSTISKYYSGNTEETFTKSSSFADAHPSTSDVCICIKKENATNAYVNFPKNSTNKYITINNKNVRFVWNGWSFKNGATLGTSTSSYVSGYFNSGDGLIIVPIDFYDNDYYVISDSLDVSEWRLSWSGLPATGSNGITLGTDFTISVSNSRSISH